ncbi:hypothetical protein SRABI106_02629 [Rahnella aquatilis]|nr:hypothetical protein SRABI106_02629 [Rahnella aquatilis]
MRMGAAELRQQGRGSRGKIFRHAETHYAVRPLVTQRIVRFTVQGDNPPRITQQPFTFFSQLHLMRRAFQQRFSQRFFQAADLLADCRLRQVHAVGRTGKTAGFADGDKTKQLLRAEHRIAIHFLNVYAFGIRNINT